MNILMVLTSHSQLGDTNHPTGFWLEEFTSPYYAFLDQGATITLASPKGGLPPVDPRSTDEGAQTESTQRYNNDPELQKKLASTITLADINPDDYDAVFYPGGHGPLWDLANDANSIAIIERYLAQGKPVGAVCHGPAVFKSVKNADGSHALKGRQVTAFSNEEEAAVELTEVVPFSLEDHFKAVGANYVRAANWQSFVVTDGLLVTGQNPQSSEETATALLKLL